MDAKWNMKPGIWAVNEAPGLATATPIVIAQTTPAARNNPPTTFNRVDIFVPSFNRDLGYGVHEHPECRDRQGTMDEVADY